MGFTHFDENGKGITKTAGEDGTETYLLDLPIGTYYVKELTTADGYTLNTSEYEFIFYPNQDGQKTLHVIAVGTTEDPLLNRPYYTPEIPERPGKPTIPEIPDNFELTKKEASDGRLIPDCGVEILDENMRVIRQGRTDEKGILTF